MPPIACCMPSAADVLDPEEEEAAAKGKDVDKQLELSRHQEALKFKILLLGSGECGKSTVLKQLKWIHQIKLSPSEVRENRFSLKRNAIECMAVLVDQAKEFGYPFEGDVAAHAEKIKALVVDLQDAFITPAVAPTIHALWKSDPIQKTFARRSEFWLLDAADYYFDNAERFVQEDFEPTEEDIVMARVMTTGIIQTDIPAPPLQFNVVDVGGQRNERRKWIHCFDNISGIVYVVNLAGYNTVLFEDRSANRIEECLALFKQTVNNPIFQEVPIFLMFNKKDLFESKIKKCPITECPTFKDYAGNGEIMDCLNFIAGKYKAQVTTNPERVQVSFVAARFKRDIKTTWEEIVGHLKKKHSKQIESAVKAIEKSGAATK